MHKRKFKLKSERDFCGKQLRKRDQKPKIEREYFLIFGYETSQEHMRKSVQKKNVLANRNPLFHFLDIHN